MTPLDLFDAPPHSGSPTSLAAALSVGSVTAQLRARILTQLASTGPLGQTCDELCVALQLDGNTVRPRLWEMDGSVAGRPVLVAKIPGLTRRTRHGREAAVYALTAAGWSAVRGEG